MALARKLTSKIYEIKAHNGDITCLDLGETGRVLVTGGRDRNVNLWAIGQDECFMSLTGHNRPIDCVRFAYKDDYVYSADDIGIIRRWDLNAQTSSSTLNGHMKSVRTLDFNPSGEYVVSGSNDTTVRLWDVRNQNKCIKSYRGHIASVNSVKFSPDGLWIASAGTEGSVLIWDIRRSKQIMIFTDNPPGAAITCIQYHPVEFLLAVGRVDGSVCIYDLERQVRISKIEDPNAGAVKCLIFSDNGECLFVGTNVGVTVFGWEPDREFDRIESSWSTLGDMKVVNKRLICSSYEKEFVFVDSLSVDCILPFYNPSNMPSDFTHNSTTRKSFSRGNQKLRLSIGGPKASRLDEESEESKSHSLDEQSSSPNLSLELVDEPASDPPSVTYSQQSTPTTSLKILANSNFHSEDYYVSGHTDLYNIPAKKTLPLNYNYPPMTSNTGYISLGGIGISTSGYNGGSFDGPSSLRNPRESYLNQFESMGVTLSSSDIENKLNESDPPVITNYDHTEMVEDFPINLNNYQQSSTSTVTSSHQSLKTARSKTTSQIQRRATQNPILGLKASSSSLQHRGKLSQMSSVSSTDLHKLDDNVLLKKSATSHFNAAKFKKNGESQSQLNKENARNKNITVQIITKPPTRARTSLDLRPSQKQTTMQRQVNLPVNHRPDPSLLTSSGVNYRNANRNNIDDNSEIQMLSISHEQVYQELSNRHAMLQLIRNSTRSHDIVGALKQAIKINGRTIFVDLLGAILEKTSSWNLDLCLLLLPEIYDLLQSQHKFHFTRACDTLRVILSNFLPIIQQNLDPWAANNLGVDVSREERQRKCIECQHWLLQIRNLPETNHFGTTLSQLQNMIVNV